MSKARTWTVRPTQDVGEERRPLLTWATEYTGDAVTSNATMLAAVMPATINAINALILRTII